MTRSAIAIAMHEGREDDGGHEGLLIGAYFDLRLARVARTGS
jgi:hypothetical protein